MTTELISADCACFNLRKAARVTAQIYDQGPGFDHSTRMADPAPSDPLSERGRGILIMQAFMDTVEYSKSQDGGTCVKIAKTCEEPSSSQPD